MAVRRGFGCFRDPDVFKEDDVTCRDCADFEECRSFVKSQRFRSGSFFTKEDISKHTPRETSVEGNLFPVIRREDIITVGATGDHETFWGRLLTNIMQGLFEATMTEFLKTLISIRGKWYI